jgi:hypothetical protein
VQEFSVDQGLGQRCAVCLGRLPDSALLCKAIRDFAEVDGDNLRRARTRALQSTAFAAQFLHPRHHFTTHRWRHEFANLAAILSDFFDQPACYRLQGNIGH